MRRIGSAVLLIGHGCHATATAKDPENDSPSAGDAALFDRLDANHNDAIAADEVSAENRPLFDRLVRKADANHDQVLSRNEFAASLKPTARPSR